MPRACGGAIQYDKPAPFQYAVDDSFCQVLVVENLAPIGERRLVGREYDGSPEYMPVIHHMEQDVGRIGAIVEVADFIYHQDGRRGVNLQRLAQPSLAAGRRELFDQGGRRDEPGGEAILDGLVRYRHRQMRLPAAGFAHEYQVLALRDEFRAKI